MLRPMLYEQTKPALFSNFFDDFFESFFKRLDGGNTDLLDKGDHYLLQAELPGFQKEDIAVSLENDMLTIRARHQEDRKEEKENFIKRERNLSSYQRTFSLDGVDKDRITASYRNGILELTLPKTENIGGGRAIEIQ